MRSYLEILDELMKTVETDILPEADKETIEKHIQALFDLLWKYSN